MLQTENYSLNIAEGTDKYNHLTIDNPNYRAIDAQMKVNEVASIPVATELKSGSVHAITRSKPDANMFRFTATSNYEAGETFTVDNVQVTALLPTGETLGNGSYVIGAEVLAVLVGTRMTVYVPQGTVAKASDSDRLGGELPEYYATATQVELAQSTASAAGQLATQNQNDINAINENNQKTIFGRKMLNFVNGVATLTFDEPLSSPYYTFIATTPGSVGVSPTGQPNTDMRNENSIQLRLYAITATTGSQVYGNKSMPALVEYMIHVD